MLKIPLRDGEILSVRSVGRGQPVVLLHGFGSNSAHWLPNVLPLAHRFCFILPDLRGFGHSHQIPLNSADIFTNYVQDIEDVLNYLKLDKVILGGISMGALTGLKFNQLGHFNRVEKYLHIDQAPQVRNLDGWQDGLFGAEQTEMFERFRSLLTHVNAVGIDTPYWDLPLTTRREMLAIFGEFFGYAMSRPLQRVFWRQAFHYGERALIGSLLGEECWYTYMQIMNSYVNIDNDTRPELANIQIPMTLMIGARSIMYPPAGQLVIASAVPHAKVVTFEKSGHLPMFDQPIKFQREFANFLNQ
jgi:non-heme chloroperoxidase